MHLHLCLSEDACSAAVVSRVHDGCAREACSLREDELSPVTINRAASCNELPRTLLTIEEDCTCSMRARLRVFMT